jgi:hypothetical protein
VPDLTRLSLTVSIILFAAATEAVVEVGPRMVGRADHLSEWIGSGKASLHHPGLAPWNREHSPFAQLAAEISSRHFSTLRGVRFDALPAIYR